MSGEMVKEDNKNDDDDKPLENASNSMTTTPKKERKQLPKPQEVRINHHDLQNRLSHELHAEERYKLINDAKLRAMTQGTASYEDFRQIWMAAHLRPLEKDDRLKSGTCSKVVWNPMSSKDKPASEQGPDNSKSTKDDDITNT